MSSYPRISIITPSFNQGQYLEETILSVINQGYPNLEYIIIDGGSTDNSVEIIKKYEDKLTYWVSEKDSGQSHAINKGMEKVTGEIFNWLNSDDYLEQGVLFLLAEMFRSTNANVVCGRAKHFGAGTPYISPPSTYFDPENNIAFIPRINQPATFFKMDIIKKLMPLNNRLHYCMDLEWWMKYLFMFGHKRIAFTEEVLANFREHESSKTMSQSYRFVEDKCLLVSGILSKKKGNKNLLGDYCFDCPIDNFSVDFLERMSSKELLMGVVVFYGRKDLDKVKVLIDLINPLHLDINDKKKLSDIKNRLKFIPKFLLMLKKVE